MTARNITIEEARARISPTSDIFARWLLSAPNHEHLTKAFINAVLEYAGHEQIASVTILSPFNLAQSMTRKETVLDVKVSDSSGRTYDVEIQTTTAEMFWNRITSAFILQNVQTYGKKRVPATGKTDVVLPALWSFKLQ